MNVFVINSGSSSIKYQLLSIPEATKLCSGLVERIGQTGTLLKHYTYNQSGSEVLAISLPDKVNHETALAYITEALVNPDYGVLKSLAEIDIVGHRVLHGGQIFVSTTLINETVKTKIKTLFPLGPLHLPPNMMGIEVAEKLIPAAKQVAVFDTAFHQTIPSVAHTFPISTQFKDDYGVRVYGFHGTSHQYIAKKAMTFLQNDAAKIISIHLGNGCSVTAIAAGKSIDTSMGMGPLSGLMMGTRCGDIDPTVVFHLLAQTGVSPEALQDSLNKKSGLQGICGRSDMRDVKQAMQAGDTMATLAYEMYAYRIKKYIGAYMAVLNGADAIIFTGGVGENDASMRNLCVSDLSYLGIIIGEVTKPYQNGIRSFHAPASKIKLLIIPTNEELAIAEQCYDFVTASPIQSHQ